MSDQWAYVLAAWAVTLAVLGAFAVLTVRRGRALSRQVPPEDRRWM